MNNTLFRKTTGVWENIDIQKLLIIEVRIKYLVPKPNYETTKNYSGNLLAIETKRIQVLMNKPIYLGLSIVEISEILMHKSWYDNVKPKHGETAELCYMDTDGSIVYIKQKTFT